MDGIDSLRLTQITSQIRLAWHECHEKCSGSIGEVSFQNDVALRLKPHTEFKRCAKFICWTASINKVTTRILPTTFCWWQMHQHIICWCCWKLGLLGVGFSSLKSSWRQRSARWCQGCHPSMWIPSKQTFQKSWLRSSCLTKFTRCWWMMMVVECLASQVERGQRWMKRTTGLCFEEILTVYLMFKCLFCLTPTWHLYLERSTSSRICAEGALSRDTVRARGWGDL